MRRDGSAKGRRAASLPPMADLNDDDFVGYDHNDYQSTMHSLAIISLWLIIVSGVACGAYGFFWGLGR